MTRRVPLVLVMSVLAAGTAAAAMILQASSFLGAPSGVAQSFEVVPLPPVSPSPPAQTLLQKALRVPVPDSAFTPTLAQLTQGDTVITSGAQMREVWSRLFSVPYDASLFDFSTTFVVLMGGGQVSSGSFDVSAVETVDASYANPGGSGGASITEPFLSVTATTYLSGVQPVDPPPSPPRISAVKIDRSLLGEIVFHRTLIMGV